MHTPATCETQRLGENERTIGVSFDTSNHSFKIIYCCRPATRSEPHRPNISLGLIIGALLMLGTLGYGMPTLGGLVLAALLVLAVWNAQRS